MSQHMVLEDVSPREADPAPHRFSQGVPLVLAVPALAFCVWLIWSAPMPEQALHECKAATYKSIK